MGKSGDEQNTLFDLNSVFLEHKRPCFFLNSLKSGERENIGIPHNNLLKNALVVLKPKSVVVNKVLLCYLVGLSV